MNKTRFFQSLALALALCFSPCFAWGAGPAGGSGTKAPEFKEGELLVKFRRGVGVARKAQIRHQLGLKDLKHFRRVGTDHLRITAPGLGVRKAAKLLETLPDVLYAEPNYRLSIAAESIYLPNDPMFSQLWGLHNTGQTGGTPGADIDAPEAWNITTGSSGVVVGVIDTGVDYTHVDLAANMWTNPGEIPENGIDDDFNGYIDDVYGIDAANGDSDPFDDNDHGTHVSGTIGGVGNNGTGVAGVNWNVKIMALKFLDASGSGWASDAIECLDYAVMMKTTCGVNLKLTSNSWGGGGFSQAVKDAIQATHAAGMLFIAAAGNYGTNNDVIPHYPSSYDVANIVAVAATDHNDNLASFSSYGATSVDLSAPGVAILSTTPGNTYSSFNGTSMATPHVAGAAALLWANDPALTNLDVKEILMATVDPVPGLAGRVVTGGRLNVYNALTCSPDVVNFIVSLDDGFFAEQELPIELSARLSACTLLRDAAVSAEFSNGDPTVDLTDDGVDPDLTADDGIYTAEWIPDALGPVTVTFAAWHAGDIYTTTATSDVVEFSGYYYDDTVPFSWIDISATGTPLNLFDDDNAYISVPFPVSFYGASYDNISIGSNGHVYFEDSWSNYSNSCIPGDTGSANTFIAAFWDDLNPEAGGQVYWEVRGTAPSRMLIIQYQDIPHFFNAGAASFEIILYEDTDDIFVQYLDVGFGNAAYDFGASATVGVQRSSSYGQQYSCAEPVLADNTAILWYYWAQPTLTEIHLQDPNNGALLSSAPTFDWTADAGANNAFVIDVALFPSGPIHTLGLFYVTNWTIPNSTWDLIPHGSIMYWRVRGADLAQEPLTIITSDEIWWFYKY